MLKTISSYMNVALEDYDDSMLNHLVELLKESLREQNDNIFENTWKIEESKRKLLKSENGEWVPLPLNSILSEDIETGEILEVMTVRLTVCVET